MSVDRMRIWFPAIRTNSGSDAYVERLAALVTAAGHEAVVSWYPLHYEFTPWRLRNMVPPAGTVIIHANSWNAFAFAGRNVPVVATVHHGVYRIGYPDWKSLSQAIYHNHWISLFERLSLRVASAVIAVSASTAADIERTYGLNSVRVIDNWLDTSIFRPGRAASGHWSPKVLFAGNLSRRKGGDLLEIFRQALDATIELHVVTGRRGVHLSALDRLPNTTVRSDIGEEDLMQLYRDCDVLVSLSRHEGFGYTALEAMACGKPVVAFDVAGIRDVVEKGRTGLLVPSDDVIGAAAACKHLIENRAVASAMGAYGRERAVQRFSLEVATERYMALYKSLI